MRIIFISLLLLSLIFGNCYAAGLGKLPTAEQIAKYCVGVRLKIDNDIHYFSYTSIKSFTEEGIIIIYGKNKNKENFIPKEDILNFDEAMARYQELQKEFNQGVIR